MDKFSGQKRAAQFLFPSIDPFDSMMLDVGGGHEIYVERCGNPKGKPVIVLHGGPGGGCSPLSYLTACQELLIKGGLMICSTINRNPKSFAMAIVGAEYVMRWLPKGTHEWSKFIKPDELYQLISESGLTPVDKKGFVFNPIKWSWALSDRDLSVNYVTASVNDGKN